MNTKLKSKIALLAALASFYLAFAAQSVPISAAITGDKSLNSGAGTDTSANWAGYASSGGKYTQVEGTWTVPDVSYTNETAAHVVWVGIGGVSGSDLIQAGTQAASDSSGEISYRAWYELLPQTSQSIPVDISPNDSVTVSIDRQSGDEWKISFTNNTTGEDYDLTVAYDSSMSSAEWIVEAPATSRGLLPLDDFGSVTFTDCAATKDGDSLDISALNPEKITMINKSNESLAEVSSIDNEEEGFTVTRTDATPDQYATYSFGHGRSFRTRGFDIRIRINHGHMKYQFDNNHIRQ